MLINKHEGVGLKYSNDSNTFIEYSNDMDNIYKICEEYHPNKEHKILITFVDMIAKILSNELILGRELNISVVFITQSYCISKTIRKKIKLLEKNKIW